LGIGYELGNICAKYYSKNAVPNDKILINDLRNLLSVYRELFGHVGTSIFSLEEFGLEADHESSPEAFKEVREATAKPVESKEDLMEVLQQLENSLREKAPRERQRLATAISRNQKIVRKVKELACFHCAICGVQGFEKEDGSYIVKPITGRNYQSPS